MGNKAAISENSHWLQYACDLCEIKLKLVHTYIRIKEMLGIYI